MYRTWFSVVIKENPCKKFAIRQDLPINKAVASGNRKKLVFTKKRQLATMPD
jgi:hypothetical protein